VSHLPIIPGDSLPPRSAAFVEPMECLAVSKLPEGSQWVYEIKLDGTALSESSRMAQYGCSLAETTPSIGIIR